MVNVCTSENLLDTRESGLSQKHAHWLRALQLKYRTTQSEICRSNSGIFREGMFSIGSVLFVDRSFPMFRRNFLQCRTISVYVQTINN